MTNMIMAEFNQRELDQNGIIRVNVKDHKTANTYASAPLVLYPLEFKWISMFVNNVRRKISKINHFMEWKQENIR